MKIKRITAVLLSVIMTVCAAAGAAFPAAAESPSDCDAVVSLYNNGALSAQISCKEGDIITHLNGATVFNVSQVSEIINDFSGGDTVDLTVYRNGEALNFTITLGSEELQ